MAAKRDEVWLMRTLFRAHDRQGFEPTYRQNLAKGQTGLSVAFDLPTQTGYDSDHPIAQAEVGKVGVPVCHIEEQWRPSSIRFP